MCAAMKLYTVASENYSMHYVLPYTLLTFGRKIIYSLRVLMHLSEQIQRIRNHNRQR